jgi:ribose transport system substrate-binding protein
MKKTLTGALAVSAALALAACSSSGTSSGSSTAGGGGTSGGATSVPASTGGGGSSAGGGNSSGITAAKAYEQKFLKTPTNINISTALKSKPPTGKTLIGLDSGLGSAKVLAQYWKQAAQDLGWKYVDIISGADPESQQKAMESAIQQNPSGILTSGIPISTIKSQLQEAQQKGIWVNTSASTDQPSGAMFDTSIANPDQLHEWGKMVAAYVTVESGGKAVVQDFSLPVFPILEEFDKAFQAAIKQWCPGCKVSEHPQQGTDIGTKTPQDVVSVVQANPSTNWLIFDLGDLETGVDAALASAGLTGLHIGGLTADTPNLQGLKQKKQDVWTAYSLPIVGYRQVDSMARKFEGSPTLNATLPTQLITQDNVNSLVVDSAGNYVGVKDYRQQFDKLWHVSG